MSVFYLGTVSQVKPNIPPLVVFGSGNTIALQSGETIAYPPIVVPSGSILDRATPSESSAIVKFPVDIYLGGAIEWVSTDSISIAQYDLRERKVGTIKRDRLLNAVVYKYPKSTIAKHDRVTIQSGAVRFYPTEPITQPETEPIQLEAETVESSISSGAVRFYDFDSFPVAPVQLEAETVESSISSGAVRFYDFDSFPVAPVQLEAETVESSVSSGAVRFYDFDSFPVAPVQLEAETVESSVSSGAVRFYDFDSFPVAPVQLEAETVESSVSSGVVRFYDFDSFPVAPVQLEAETVESSVSSGAVIRIKANTIAKHDRDYIRGGAVLKYVFVEPLPYKAYPAQRKSDRITQGTLDSLIIKQYSATVVADKLNSAMLTSFVFKQTEAARIDSKNYDSVEIKLFDSRDNRISTFIRDSFKNSITISQFISSYSASLENDTIFTVKPKNFYRPLNADIVRATGSSIPFSSAAVNYTNLFPDAILARLENDTITTIAATGIYWNFEPNIVNSNFKPEPINYVLPNNIYHVFDPDIFAATRKDFDLTTLYIGIAPIYNVEYCALNPQFLTNEPPSN